MKRRIQMVVFVLAAMGVFEAGARAQELKVGDMAPDFTLKASDGQTYTLSKLRGKTVMLAWSQKGAGDWTHQSIRRRVLHDQHGHP